MALLWVAGDTKIQNGQIKSNTVSIVFDVIFFICVTRPTHPGGKYHQQKFKIVRLGQKWCQFVFLSNKKYWLPFIKINYLRLRTATSC